MTPTFWEFILSSQSTFTAVSIVSIRLKKKIIKQGREMKTTKTKKNSKRD